MSAGAKAWIPRIENLLDLLYPRSCLQCDAPMRKSSSRSAGIDLRDEREFCASCWKTVLPLAGPCCPVCSAPFRSKEALSYSPDHHCGECREDPPPFSRAITPFVYDGVVATAVQRLKYDKKTGLALPLADLMVGRLPPLEADRVVAIPLHPRRLRAREFNQSLLLAKEVARSLALPLLIDPMERVRETLPQVGLSRKERQKNVRRAFSVARPDQIQDQRILLIDDVYTTGATLREGAGALMRSGAKTVTVAALARMP